MLDIVLYHPTPLSTLKTHRHSPPPPPRPLQFRYQLPHNLSPGQPDLHVPPRIRPPTYQCTKARLLYIKSNLWSMREKTSAMAVELLIMHTARMTFARSPPGTTVGGW